MKLRPNELLIYYNGDDNSHKKIKAYAYSVAKYVKEWDINQKMVTKLMWEDILSMLNMRPKEIMNKANPKYQTAIARHEFDEEGWLDILKQNPDLLKAPIAIMEEKAVLCTNPKDVYKLYREVEHPDEY